MEKMGLSVAIKRFLMLPDEKIGQIMGHIKSLDAHDKEWLKERFIVEGIADIT